MNPRPDFCPGCGAQVYPEEDQCPFCGRGLRASPWLPFLLGLGGAGAALVVGALVWWVLQALPPPEQAAAPPLQQEAAVAPAQPQPEAAAPAAPDPFARPASLLAPPPAGASPQALAPVPGFAPAPAPAEPATASTKDAQRFGAAPAGGDPAAAPAPASMTADAAVGEQQLALPTLHGPAPQVEADVAGRKAFAKSTQDRFTENGLDLTVGTSAGDATTLTITFNFPAKTAAELIVAGPFPRQCAQRGFKQVVFQDPSGASWLYDMATQQMTQR